MSYFGNVCVIYTSLFHPPTIGTSYVDDGVSATVADITPFPNPVEDYLLVTLGE